MKRITRTSALTARLDPDAAAIGTRLEVEAARGPLTATGVKFPVYDTQKTRTHQ